jgi:hypothetical protein
VFDDEWFSLELNPEEKQMIIAWRELYAIVLACTTWGHKLCGRKLIIHCDNATICDIVNSGTTKNRDIMCLVRVLYYVCVQFNFMLKLEHIAGVLNIAADRLSRLDLGSFREEFSARYKLYPTPVRRNLDEFGPCV